MSSTLWEFWFLLFGLWAIGWVSVNKNWSFTAKLKRLSKLNFLTSISKRLGGLMNNLPVLFGNIANIPTLKNTDFISRVFHSWKLEDLARIAELEGRIAENNLMKMKCTMQAMTEMATFGERIKAEMESVELGQRMLRAQVREQEAKAKILETESKKEEFDFFEYMKRAKDED